MVEFNHHGIEGQKWGVQNGPPYPLDKQTAKEVKKQAKQAYKDAKKKTKEVIRKEATEYENSRWKNLAKHGYAYGNSDTQLRTEAEKLIRETYNKKMDYKTIQKGKEWVDKHKNRYLNIYASNIVMGYIPETDKTVYTRTYHY